MSIKLRWYSGAYYNTAQIIESITSSDKQYWGTAGSSLSYYCSPPSLLSFMSGESSMDPLSRFHRLKKENEINALEEEVIGRIAASTLLTKNQIIMYMKLCDMMPPIYDPIIESWIMDRRLKKLMELQLLEQVTLNYSTGNQKHIAYRITEFGQLVARKNGVRIHKGTCVRVQRIGLNQASMIYQLLNRISLAHKEPKTLLWTHQRNS